MTHPKKPKPAMPAKPAAGAGNVPTFRERMKWAKAAGFEIVTDPFTHAGRVKGFHLYGVQFVSFKHTGWHKEWRPDLYPSHAAPLVAALGLTVVFNPSLGWGYSDAKHTEVTYHRGVYSYPLAACAAVRARLEGENGKAK